MSLGEKLKLNNPFLKQTPTTFNYNSNNNNFNNNTYSNTYGANDSYAPGSYNYNNNNSQSNHYSSYSGNNYNNYDALIYRPQEQTQTFNKYSSYASSPVNTNSFYGSSASYTSQATFSNPNKYKENAYTYEKDYRNSPYLGTDRNQYNPGITDVADFKRSNASRQFQYSIGKSRENQMDKKHSLRQQKDIKQMLENNPFSKNKNSQNVNKQIDNYGKYEKLQYKPNFLLGTSNVSYAPSYDNYINYDSEDLAKQKVKSIAKQSYYTKYSDDLISDDHSSTSNTYINKIMEQAQDSASLNKPNPFQRKGLLQNKNQAKQNYKYKSSQYEDQVPIYERYTNNSKSPQTNYEQSRKMMKQSNNSIKNYRTLNLQDSYERSQKSDKFQMANFKVKQYQKLDYLSNGNRENYDRQYQNENTQQKIDQKYQSLRYKKQSSQKSLPKYNFQQQNFDEFQLLYKNEPFQQRERESLKVVNYLNQSQKYPKSDKFNKNDYKNTKPEQKPEKDQNYSNQKYASIYQTDKQPSFGLIQTITDSSYTNKKNNLDRNNKKKQYFEQQQEQVQEQNQQCKWQKRRQKDQPKKVQVFQSKRSHQNQNFILKQVNQKKIEYEREHKQVHEDEYKYESTKPHKNKIHQSKNEDIAQYELPTINEAYEFKDMDQFQKQYEFNFDKDQYEEQFQIPLRNQKKKVPSFQYKIQQQQITKKSKNMLKEEDLPQKNEKIIKQKLYETDEQQFRLSSDYDNLDLQFEPNSKYKSPFDTKIQQVKKFNKLTESQRPQFQSKSQKKIIKFDDNEQQDYYYAPKEKINAVAQNEQNLPIFGKKLKQKQIQLSYPIKDKRIKSFPQTLQFRGDIYHKMDLQSQTSN